MQGSKPRFTPSFVCADFFKILSALWNFIGIFRLGFSQKSLKIGSQKSGSLLIRLLYQKSPLLRTGIGKCLRNCLEKELKIKSEHLRKCLCHTIKAKVGGMGVVHRHHFTVAALEDLLAVDEMNGSLGRMKLGESVTGNGERFS